MNLMKGLGKTMIVVGTAVLTTACGTLTVISDNKRSSVEQTLVSSSIKGALKQFDISSLRDKTVVLEIRAIENSGGSSITGGRGRMGFSLYGNAVSTPTTRTSNVYDVVPLNNSSHIDSVQRMTGGSSVTTNSSSSLDATGNAESNTDTSNSSTGTSSSSDTTDIGGSTNTSTSSSSTDIGGSTNTNTTSTTTDVGGSTNTSTDSSSSTTTTGGTTTEQTAANTNTTEIGGSTNTTTNSSSTEIGGSTNTSTGSSSTDIGGSTNTSTGSTDSSSNSTSNSATTGTTNDTQDSTALSVQTSSHFQNTSGSSQTTGVNDAFTPGPVSSRQQTRGRGYEGRYGVSYSGLGEAYAFAVPASDMTILTESIKQYFLLNDVKIILSPKDPRAATADVHVSVLVSVFGSTRARTDVLLYNNETLEVTTVMELTALNRHNLSLAMPIQRGSYKASYKEKYMGWIGPFNKKKARFRHGVTDDAHLVTFDDLAKQKIQRDEQKNEAFSKLHQDYQRTIQGLTFELEQNIHLQQQRDEIRKLQQQIEQLKQGKPLSALQAPKPVSKQVNAARLLAQNNQGATIQLLAHKDESYVKNYIKQNKLTEHAYYYQTQRQDGVYYVLLYGNFSHLNEARKYIDQLPYRVLRDKPWIRNYQDLKANYRPVQTAQTQLSTEQQGG